MADTETAPAVAPTKPSKKKVAASKNKPAGPSVSDLTVKAVGASKERHGLSLPALKKALKAAGYDVEKNNARLLLSLRSLVSKGKLLQHKGSYKLNKKEAPKKVKTAKKKPVAKAKTPGTAKKSKKTAAAGSKKKAPKKAKKPAAAKKTAKSPKKVKSAKPKAAKSPAKKPVKPKALKPKSAPKAKKTASKAKK
ncbi:histone H1-like [Protopterus annectens]|uniref:histone H1-like n=1 Tax=Protopterus annectens TaxID=7888 RepID=UPI001CFB803B|nr:histone H1-like [Protopterus annectens]XP_043930572.1 histone H1-like [Protopterus annectens]